MAALHSTLMELPAGGGPFALERLTIGVFLNAQPDHRLAVGRDRSEAIPLEAQQGWIMPAGAEGLCTYDAPLELQTLELDGALLADAGIADPGAIAPVVGSINPLLLQMVGSVEAFSAGDRLYRETMERALAVHLARLIAPVSEPTRGIDDDRLKRVVEHIHDQLETDLSLEDMAGLAAMSPSRFSHAFKAAMGTSPLQYVIGARMDRAKVLLDTTDLTVAEISWRVGYEDSGRFGRHFRARAGLTPGGWRQR